MTHFPPQPGEVMCFGCKFFQDDRDNDAAMGRCMHPARHGYFFPCEWHRCVDREEMARKPA